VKYEQLSDVDDVEAGRADLQAAIRAWRNAKR
jgi:hypothetical protein